MPDPEPQPHVIRLQRYLAACGLGSRRGCEELIVAGRVTVDGEVVDELGAKVDPQRQKVALDGEALHMERKKYYVVNKPLGVLSTTRDPQGRPRVIDLFPPGGPRLFTVGRLDEDSEGLLIVTNDGDLAQKLAHPRYRFYRTYHVQVAGDPKREELNQLKKGLHFAEGRFKVHDIRPLRKQGKSMHLEVVLTEGQNRELRRMFARLGHKVMKLRRVAFGPIHLGRLRVGQFREVTREELAELFAILARNLASGAERRELRLVPTPSPTESRRRQWPKRSRRGGARPR
jgi:23S rRNA pseudouridine2605 synthase